MSSRTTSLKLPMLISIVLAGEALGEEPLKHDRWDRLLKANVSEAGWVDYKSLRSKDAGELRDFLRELSEADPSQLKGKHDRKAFWINAYNAVCLQSLIDEGVPDEVPRAKLFGANVFTQRKYQVAGMVRSLDDIEHGILRKEYADRRIHAAVVCGASSCPRLRNEAYVGAQLDHQLDDQARSWITIEKNKKGERKNRLDRQAKVLYVSKIFSWYEEDFRGGQSGVVDFVKTHSDPSDREFLEKTPVTLHYLPYDWSLNRR